jgi:hypothetical protein
MSIVDHLDLQAWEPRRATLLARAAFVLAFVGSATWLATSLHEAEIAWRALRRPAAPAQVVRSPASAASTEPAAGDADFVQELPVVAPTDAQIRFAAKLARESELDLQRMQAEPLHVDPGHLGQVRVTLQLRGDYRDEKALLGALLAKFPGLTLERLAVRHRGDGPGARAGDARSDDEATFELTQYLRPAGA